MRRISMLLTTLVTAAAMLLPLAPAEAAAYTVSISRNKTWLTIGQSFTLTGKVSNSFKGAPVELQRYDGRAVTIKKFTTGPYGTYSVSWSPASLGLKLYRVCRPAGGAYTRGCSSWVSESVYRWHDLAGWTPYDYDSVSSGTVNINGTSYISSLSDDYPWSSTPNWVEYNLNRKCKTLQASYGLDANQSDSGASGRIEVSTDGSLRYSRQFTISGADTNRWISLDNALRLKVGFFQLSSELEATGAVGRPRILCMF